MRIFWGLLVTAIGAFLSISGLTKSDFVVYRLVVARSRLLWGDKVHLFYVVAGAIVIIAGVLMAIGVLWNAKPR